MLHSRCWCAIALASVVLVAAGCSKKEPEAPPAPPVPPKAQKPEMPPPEALPPLPPEVKPMISPKAATPAPAPTAQEETPAQRAAQVKQLERDYYNTPDFQKRVVVIYNLSSVESPETIDAMSRLFLNEHDPELKVELVNSLSDIDGENDKKLTLLSGAIRPDQPKDVRLEAIDALADTEDKRAIQLLQGLLSDPDEEIREAAQDAIEQLQADVAATQ
jgi:type IV secretory pathway VirB10-like protein